MHAQSYIIFGIDWFKNGKQQLVSNRLGFETDHCLWSLFGLRKRNSFFIDIVAVIVAIGVDIDVCLLLLLLLFLSFLFLLRFAVLADVVVEKGIIYRVEYKLLIIFLIITDRLNFVDFPLS